MEVEELTRDEQPTPLLGEHLPDWALPCFNLAALLDRTGRGAEAELLAASCPAAPAASGGTVARR